MPILFDDQWAGAAGTDVVAGHVADTGQGWAFQLAGSSNQDQSPKLTGDGCIYYSATGGDAIVAAAAPAAPASAVEVVGSCRLTRKGAMASGLAPGSVYFFVADDFQAGVNTDEYGFTFAATDANGSGQWNIRKVPKNGGATQVLNTETTAKSYFPAVGDTCLAILTRTAIQNGVRLTLWVAKTNTSGGVTTTTLAQVATADDVSNPITRVGKPALTTGATSNLGATVGLKLGRIRMADPVTNTTPPSFTGTPQVGQELTIGGDVWSDAASVSGVVYKVQRSTDGGQTWADVAGSSGSNKYTPGANDQSPNQIRPVATAYGAGGVIATPGGSVAPAAAPLLALTDFTMKLSGGANNSDPLKSIGGAPGNAFTFDPNAQASALEGNVLDRIIAAVGQAGQKDYRLVYVENDHPTYSADLGAFIATQPANGKGSLKIGAAVEPAGTNVAAVADRLTAPDNVNFSAPSTANTAIALGTLAPGQRKGIWIERTVPAGTNPAADAAAWEIDITVSQL